MTEYFTGARGNNLLYDPSADLTLGVTGIVDNQMLVRSGATITTLPYGAGPTGATGPTGAVGPTGPTGASPAGSIIRCSLSTLYTMAAPTAFFFPLPIDTLDFQSGTGITFNAGTYDFAVPTDGYWFVNISLQLELDVLPDVPVVMTLRETTTGVNLASVKYFNGPFAGLLGPAIVPIALSSLVYLQTISSCGISFQMLYTNNITWRIAAGSYIEFIRM